ncbi:hypothetical protein JKP88DRAFT_300663 [Tribonema minus]|uniref:Uncharacterized protein n=1 Tax=Tribonema minus TaxID=303371 RepID=A0A835Z8U1_9STRA|nr:hypothetical protein JKP88DRAFT_300663 [Tribonema minus]
MFCTHLTYTQRLDFNSHNQTATGDPPPPPSPQALAHCSLTFHNTARFAHRWYQLPVARLLKAITAPEAIRIHSVNSEGRADSPDPGFRALWRRLCDGILAVDAHPTVQRLSVCGFGWDDGGLSAVLDGLARGAFAQLRELDLSHNAGGARRGGRAPPTSCSLHFLCKHVLLRGCCPRLAALRIHDAVAAPAQHQQQQQQQRTAAAAADDAPAAAAAAACAVRLRELEADVAVVLSAELFPQSLLRSLRTLTLWGWAAARPAAGAIVDALACAPCAELQSLTLRQVDFGPPAATAVAAAADAQEAAGEGDALLRLLSGAALPSLRRVRLCDARALGVEIAELVAELPGPQFCMLKLSAPRHRAAADASAAALFPAKLTGLLSSGGSGSAAAAAAAAAAPTLSAHFSGLAVLDLSNACPSHLPTSAALLRAAAAACPRLTALTLAGNDLGCPGAAAPLREALAARRWPALETLVLNATDLEDAAFASLCSALSGVVPTAALGAAVAAGSATAAAPRLRRLELRCCGLRAAAMAALRACAAAGALPSLEHLDVSGNPIGDAGAAALARALPHAPRAAALLAMGCDIAAPGLGAIVGCMREGHAPRLRLLHICCNQLLHRAQQQDGGAGGGGGALLKGRGGRAAHCGGGSGDGSGAGGYGELRDVLVRRCCPDLRELWVCGSGALRHSLHGAQLAGLQLGSCGLCGV